MIGPKATAAPKLDAHAAKAVARTGPWNVLEMIEIVAGSINDAPMPSISASPRTSTGTVLAIEAMNEPAPNRAAPTMNMRRAPKMSAKRPPITRNVANVSE